MTHLKRSALLACGLGLGAGLLAAAHGGTYTGPLDTVPIGGGGFGPGPTPPPGASGPGPIGPRSSDTGGRNGPNVPSPTGGTLGPDGSPSQTGGLGNTSQDLTRWIYWWEFNKGPFLNLRESLYDLGTRTGDDEFWLGTGEEDVRAENLRPSSEQIRGQVVPALLAALETETNNDILTGSLIALAKIHPDRDESGDSIVATECERLLRDSNQEIAETAALSFGILGDEGAVPTLIDLMGDSGRGRKLVGRGEVPFRSRAFAAYALGLIGKKTSSEELRQTIVAELWGLLSGEPGASRDLPVAAVISLGIVPLEPRTADSQASPDAGPAPPRSREEQIAFLIELLENDDYPYLVRAHVPVALARLGGELEGAAGRAGLLADVVEALLAPLEPRSRAEREIRQSAALAIGLLAQAGDNPLDASMRERLLATLDKDADAQVRAFCQIALAEIGGRAERGEASLAEIQSALLKSLARSSNVEVRGWSGIALGLLGRRLRDAGGLAPAEVTAAMVHELRQAKNPSLVGALAIGCGLLGSQEAAPALRAQFEQLREDEARGYVALGLGMVGDTASIERIRQVLEESQYRPELLRQAASALGLLGDKSVGRHLVVMLSEAKGLASQAACSSALGFIGDRHSIEPLVRLLQDEEKTDRSRGFAAAALGLVGDPAPLPWNTPISVDLNYRASTRTLNDPAQGAGIANLL